MTIIRFQSLFRPSHRDPDVEREVTDLIVDLVASKAALRDVSQHGAAQRNS